MDRHTASARQDLQAKYQTAPRATWHQVIPTLLHILISTGIKENVHFDIDLRGSKLVFSKKLEGCIAIS